MRESTMKAGVMYERHKPLVLDDVDLADPTANEVEVELVASGVCQSNLHRVQPRHPRNIACQAAIWWAAGKA
jgi:Zn-dependent alcohol dehydrogenase